MFVWYPDYSGSSRSSLEVGPGSLSTLIDPVPECRSDCVQNPRGDCVTLLIIFVRCSDDLLVAYGAVPRACLLYFRYRDIHQSPLFNDMCMSLICVVLICV